MKTLQLKAEKLVVESFETFPATDVSEDVHRPDGCICFAPPCICTAGPDCATA